jgi:lipopolysaccharide/colanic/teichoic acid biosynthesis glycosyltransferase
MVADAEKKGAASTSNTDMRVTPVGHFIRKFKFDEFSQLLNVFIGDMSLVGPRPEVQKFVDMYTDEEQLILTVRPGITDWSSIKFHNEGEIIEASGIADADEAYAKIIRPEKLRLQLKYVRERSIWIDIKIIVCTILTIFSTRSGGEPIGVPSN